MFGGTDTYVVSEKAILVLPPVCLKLLRIFVLHTYCYSKAFYLFLCFFSSVHHLSRQSPAASCADCVRVQKSAHPFPCICLLSHVVHFLREWHHARKTCNSDVFCISVLFRLLSPVNSTALYATCITCRFRLFVHIFLFCARYIVHPLLPSLLYKAGSVPEINK